MPEAMEFGSAAHLRWLRDHDSDPSLTEEQLLGPARFIAEELRDRVKADALKHGPAIDVALASDHISVQFDDGAWLAYGEGPEPGEEQ